MFDEEYIKAIIRNVPDYPKKGIMFRDITTLLKDKKRFHMCIDEMSKRIERIDADYIVGIEARGFITGSVLAYKLGRGFIPIRKKGKLPGAVITRNYEKEYGKDTIEMHKDSIKKGDKVIITDDLLATGETANAAAELVRSAGGNVSAFAFIVELSDLNGREKLSGKIISLVKY
jgi:adenine phosphoribosyltransferase